MSLKVGGIVLCGGESRRMGRPKAWLPFGDELLLQRVVRILSGAVDTIVVVAAPDQDVPPLPPTVTLARDANKGRGPLEGLAAGLKAIRKLGCSAAYVSSTDAPLLKTDWVRQVIRLLGDAAIAVPLIDGRHHPLAAVYRTTVLPEIERLLAADRLRPVFLFESVATRVIGADELRAVDQTFDSLRNLNTPEEYEAALTQCAAVATPATTGCVQGSPTASRSSS